MFDTVALLAAVRYVTVVRDYFAIAVDGFAGYARYLFNDITTPGLNSFFYGLLLVSALVFALELLFPWRVDQPRVRRDFWLDGFYMFFNFFLFSLIGYNALSDVAVAAFEDVRGAIGLSSLVVFDVRAWPAWMQLLVLFVVRDFIHYWVHRLLHRVPRLWAFHKVHHSVRQMGFAAHLRYHPVETIVYRGLEYIPLAMIGFGLQEFFIVHMAALTIGHLNHANFRLPIGPLKYVFNSAQMHIWHHKKTLPNRYGVNYGLSLSLWDWIFGTAYWPHDGRDIELGFDDVETYPTGFAGQIAEPFVRL